VGAKIFFISNSDGVEINLERDSLPTSESVGVSDGDAVNLFPRLQPDGHDSIGMGLEICRKRCRNANSRFKSSRWRTLLSETMDSACRKHSSKTMVCGIGPRLMSIVLSQAWENGRNSQRGAYRNYSTGDFDMHFKWRRSGWRELRPSGLPS